MIYLEYQLEAITNDLTDYYKINDWLRYLLPILTLMIPFFILGLLLHHMRKYQNFWYLKDRLQFMTFGLSIMLFLGIDMLGIQSAAGVSEEFFKCNTRFMTDTLDGSIDADSIWS